MELNATIRKNLFNYLLIVLLMVIISPSCSKNESTVTSATTNSYAPAKQISLFGPAGLSNNLVYYGNAAPD